MKRLLAAGSGPIFQVAKAFRGTEHGASHNPEFTMLEWYTPGEGHLDLVQAAAALLRDVTAAAGRPGALVRQGRRIDLDANPEVLSVADAFRSHAGIDPASLTGPDREARFSLILAEQVQPHLGVDRLTALVEWPADMASLARLRPGEPSVAERVEIYVAGIELANGFTELTDAAEQRRRMESERREREALGLPELPFDERFLAALGKMPAAAGMALGVDRLVMLVAGLDDIRKAMAFPWEEA
jgi:lysyl-tRNA synthetase class 2